MNANSALRAILFILLVLNMTLGSNGWLVGRVCFWLAAIICAYFLFGRYGLKGLGLITTVVALKVLEVIVPAAETAYQAGVFIVFSLTGWICFGGTPARVRKFLILYLLFSIPFLVLQLLGSSPIVMYWNLDYAHDTSVLSEAEIGSFKDMVVYPTFLLEVSEIYYQQGQGRPSGLSPANNLLSVLVSFAAVLNLHLRRYSKLNLGDFAVNLTAVLVASKLGLIVLLFLYVYGAFSGASMIRKASFKSLTLLVFFLLLYILMFPGVSSVNFGAGVIAASFGLRIAEILMSIGLEGFLELFWFSSSEYGLNWTSDNQSENSNFSGMTMLLSSSFVAISLFAIAAIYIVIKAYKLIKRLKLAAPNLYEFYVSFLVVILACFFAVPVLFKSPLFALIMGVVLQSMLVRHKKILRA